MLAYKYMYIITYYALHDTWTVIHLVYTCTFRNVGDQRSLVNKAFITENPIYLFYSCVRGCMPINKKTEFVIIVSTPGGGTRSGFG